MSIELSSCGGFESLRDGRLAHQRRRADADSAEAVIPLITERLASERPGRMVHASERVALVVAEVPLGANGRYSSGNPRVSADRRRGSSGGAQRDRHPMEMVQLAHPLASSGGGAGRHARNAR